MPMPVELDFEPLPGDLPIGIETAGYFVVSEALANAVKHSHAEELRLSIGRPAGRLRIEVVDDGIGGALPGGGLSGLADRVDALGGWIEVESPPGEGTRILVEVPCENAVSAEVEPEGIASAEAGAPGIATAVNQGGASASRELA
jgi:signal transduction histidine kinase